MPRIGINVTGIESLGKALRAEMTRIGRGLQVGMQQAGNHLMYEANAIAPVDTGAMVQSSFVRREGSGFNTVIICGYAVPYAVFAHEDLNKVHGQAYNIRYASEIQSGKIDPSTGQPYHIRRDDEQAKWFEKTLYNNTVLMTMAVIIAGYTQSKTSATVEAFLP